MKSALSIVMKSSAVTATATKKRCCFLTLAIVLAVAIAVSVAVGVTVSVALSIRHEKPRKPEHTILFVVCHNARLVVIKPTANSKTASISADFWVFMRVRNPNKKHIKFGTSNMTIYYRGTPLGDSLLPGHSMPAGATYASEIHIAVDQVVVPHPEASHLLRESSQGIVSLRIAANFLFHSRRMNFYSHDVQAELSCDLFLFTNTTLGHGLTWNKKQPSGAGCVFRGR